VFDLLKDKGLDKTTQVILCLIIKLFQGLDKLGGKGQDENRIFCPALRIIFLLQLFHKEHFRELQSQTTETGMYNNLPLHTYIGYIQISSF
jgi:hypothetical protein